MMLFEWGFDVCIPAKKKMKNEKTEQYIKLNRMTKRDGLLVSYFMLLCCGRLFIFI